MYEIYDNREGVSLEREGSSSRRVSTNKTALRVACVGHDVYFRNHYCEKSACGMQVEWFLYDHHSNEFYREIRNFRPDITLVFRPELHLRRDLNTITGLKFGFSTEPIPKIVNGELLVSSETERRINMLRQLDFGAYTAVFHYDRNSIDFCDKFELPFADYRPIPINTDWFHPFDRPDPVWDIVFVGKATPRRSLAMQSLKSHNVNFLWVEHGVSGKELAEIFRRSRCVLNIHADELQSLEPRLYLAAACGTPTLTEPYGDVRFPFEQYVDLIYANHISPVSINSCIDDIVRRTRLLSRNSLLHQLNNLSTAAFIRTLIRKYA